MKPIWLSAAVVLLLYHALCVAETDPKTLRLITSSSIPPYVIIEENRGIVTDLMREALALKNYDINLNYSTNKRLMAELKSRRVDGAFNFPPGKIPGFYYSEPIVSYQNVAIALSENNFDIKDISDLAGKSIIAFQNSALFLGPEYKKMSDDNPRHEEVSKQRSQLFMLFMQRTDVIVMEINIFFYYLQEIQQLTGIHHPFTIFPIFPKAPRFAVFSSEKVRDDFNDGLKMLKKSGQYHIIFHRYIAEQ
jgi:polar amino acid transport system substrate-binding protein